MTIFTGTSLLGGLPAAWPRTSVAATTVLECLIEHWRAFGLPGFAQFDNDNRFTGPRQYLDAVGRVIRLCLSLGVTPVFAPPNETGFQAAIESFNGLWQAKVWQRFEHNAFWNQFWVAKMGVMGHRGVRVYSRSLRYRNQTVQLSSGGTHSFLVAEEKGIDVRIALDTIHLAYRNEYDVALMFSQDQDLSEVAEQVRLMAREQGRWIKMASAFPVSPTSRNRRGINKTD